MNILSVACSQHARRHTVLLADDLRYDASTLVTTVQAVVLANDQVTFRPIISKTI